MANELQAKVDAMSDEELRVAVEQFEDAERSEKVDVWVENTLDFISGVAQGGTFNFGDEFYAGNRALTDWIYNAGGTDFIADYNKYYQGEQIRQAMVAERSPTASTAGELAAMSAFFGKIATTKAPALTRAAMNFTMGGTSSFGSGDGKTGALQDAVVNGTLTAAGGLFPASGEVAGKMSMNVIRRIANAVVPKSTGVKEGLKGVGAMMDKNPVKAGVAVGSVSALAGQPIGAAVGFGAAGMSALKQTANKYPILEGATAQYGYEARKLRPEPEMLDYGDMSDEEFMEKYVESMTDEELLEQIKGYE